MNVPIFYIGYILYKLLADNARQQDNNHTFKLSLPNYTQINNLRDLNSELHCHGEK